MLDHNVAPTKQNIKQCIILLAVLLFSYLPNFLPYTEFYELDIIYIIFFYYLVFLPKYLPIWLIIVLGILSNALMSNEWLPYNILQILTFSIFTSIVSTKYKVKDFYNTWLIFSIIYIINNIMLITIKYIIMDYNINFKYFIFDSLGTVIIYPLIYYILTLIIFRKNLITK